MPVSIHLDAETLKRLDSKAKGTGLSRSRIIKQALQDWFAREDQNEWTRLILALAGSVPDYEGFEAMRDDVLPADENPMEF